MLRFNRDTPKTMATKAATASALAMTNNRLRLTDATNS